MLTASIETDLLLAGSHLHSSGRDTQYLSETLSKRGLDWTALIRMALDHGTAGLLCCNLLALPADVLPEQLRQAADIYLKGQRQAARATVRELFQVLDALQEQGVRAVPFKGPLLAEQAFGDFTLRRFRDIDLLIPEQDIARTMKVLTDLGYRSPAAGLNEYRRFLYYRYNGQDIFFAPGRVPLEPHWAFAPRTFGIRFEVSGVLKRAVPASLGGRAILSPCPEDTLIIAGIHGCKEAWGRLIWVADIAEYLRNGPQVDWEQLTIRARANGVLRMVLLGLGLAERVLEAPLPPEVRRLISQDTCCAKLVHEVEGVILDYGRQPPSSVFELSLFGWAVRERLSDRVSWIFRTITTARIQHLEMIELPPALSFAYPLVKLGHDYALLPLWLAAKSLRVVHRTKP